MAGMIAGSLLVSRFGWFNEGRSAPSVAEEAPAAAGPAIGGPPNFVEVAQRVNPAVVNIATTRVFRAPEGAAPSPFLDDPFFRQFFGEEFFKRFQVPRERREPSLGSGVIVDASGTIITNNHVIEKADEIKVILSDKREFDGKVIGTDPRSDLAVIQIKAENLPVVPWGDSGKLQVGEYVLAIGNPFGLNQTVTMGIVSAVGRANVGIADYEDFIQTDAAINPGNSGGALVNVRGELVGINTAIFSRSGGYMGIGFAVPSQMARSVIESLIKTGKVIRGWLGISIQDVTPELAKQFGLSETRGALVGEVMAGSPAEKGGLKRGDVIITYDERPVENSAMLRNAAAQTAVGKRVKVGVVRDRKEKTVEVVVGEQPKEVADTGSEPAGDRVTLSGIEVSELTPEIAHKFGLPSGASGIVVISVEPGTPADRAGVQPGDLILEINRKAVRSLGDYRDIVGNLDSKVSTLILVNRKGRNVFVVVEPK